MARSVDEILSSGVATIAVITVSGIALKGLENLSKPSKNNKFL